MYVYMSSTAGNVRRLRLLMSMIKPKFNLTLQCTNWNITKPNMIITKDDYKGNADQSVAYEILLLKTTSLEMNLPLFTHRGLRLRDKKKVEKQSLRLYHIV